MTRRPAGRSEPGGRELLVLVPVYDDWEAFGLLLPRLAAALETHDLEARVLVVDDASTEAPPPDLAARSGRIELEILSLRRNLGHQRAIAIGLAFAYVERPAAITVVMDGDGEDDPADVVRLVDECRRLGCTTVVFAARTRRSESLLFRLSYHGYRLAHWLLTGVPVRVGNFSAVPRRALESIVALSELWSHYSAAVMKGRIPYTTIPTARASRLAGEPSMNFVALVVHGLTAISLYGDVVGVRLLVALSAVASAVVVAIGVGFGVGAAGMPGWAGVAAGLALVVLLQAAVLSVFLLFVILAGRQATSFLPVRDYHHFIRRPGPIPGSTAGG